MIIATSIFAAAFISNFAGVSVNFRTENFALGLQTTESNLTASDFFPLAPGYTWTYTDSQNPSQRIIQKTELPKLQPNEAPYGVIQGYLDGAKSGAMFYRVHGNTVNLIGRGLFDKFTPRPILVVGGTNDWDYYADPVTPYSNVIIHITAHSQDGTPQMLFGKMRKIVVVTDDATAGGKNGLNVHQVATYAEGIGLISFTQDGTAGKGKIHDVRKLIAFMPPKSSSDSIKLPPSTGGN